MPVVLSPEHGGWIRVSPPRRKINREHQAEALKAGPLSYFACQPIPSKPTKLPPCPKYDLDDLPPPPKKGHHRAGVNGTKGKKHRTVSAPAHIDDDEEDYNYEEEEQGDYNTQPTRRHNHRSASAAVHPRPHHRPTPSTAAPAPGKYWTGPTQRHAPPPPRSNYTGSSSGRSSNSGVSARWANATAALDLG